MKTCIVRGVFFVTGIVFAITAHNLVTGETSAFAQAYSTTGGGLAVAAGLCVLAAALYRDNR